VRSDAIVARITDSNRCDAEGLTVIGHAPVLGMCRKLIEAGFDSTRPLKAYRGETLCLTVSSIGWGAGQTVEDNVCGTPSLRRWRKGQAAMVAAPHVSSEPTSV
jgi:hypothetical protein